MLNTEPMKGDIFAERRWPEGSAEWICAAGHHNDARCHFSGNAMVYSSVWDFCFECDRHPSPAQILKMKLQVFSEWLKAKVITADEYQALTQGAVSPEYRPDDPPTGPLGLPYRPGRETMLQELIQGGKP